MCDTLSEFGEVAYDLCDVLARGLRHLHHTQGYRLNAQLTCKFVDHSQLKSADDLKTIPIHYAYIQTKTVLAL